MANVAFRADRTDGAMSWRAAGRMARRAVRHDEAADFHVEALSPSEAEEHVAEWQDLSGRALERNVFCEPAFAIPAARHLLDDGRPLFLFIWDADASDTTRRLVGVVPVVAPGFHVGAGRLKVWHSRYSGNATPLLDASVAGPALDALFGWVRQVWPGLAGILFPKLEQDGPLASLLARYADSSGRVLRSFDSHVRAVLKAKDSPKTFLDQAMRHKKLKELRRQRRRLGEQGVLSERTVRDRKGVRDLFEHVLALEASGWKGRCGTAMMQNPAVAAFARSAVRQLAAARACRIDVIELDGKPVAAGIVFKSGDRAWYWKTAYDENLGRFSPGVQLALDISRRQLESKSTALTDSCAIEGHPMINHIWPDRMAIADIFVGVDATRSAPALAAARGEALRRELRRRLKSALFRFTGRRAS
jgi:CelD/BcsL family acetyltransferase involved in cellulose biosynthesis